jgi:hypothetical protein
MQHRSGVEVADLTIADAGCLGRDTKDHVRSDHASCWSGQRGTQGETRGTRGPQSSKHGLEHARTAFRSKPVVGVDAGGRSLMVRERR